jgi:hypothetical protein
MQKDSVNRRFAPTMNHTLVQLLERIDGMIETPCPNESTACLRQRHRAGRIVIAPRINKFSSSSNLSVDH